MATENGWLSSITGTASALVSTLVYVLVALVVAVGVWIVAFLSWGQAVGWTSAQLVASALALVPFVGLGYVAVVAEDGPTLSKAAYVGGFAGASVLFFIAVWTTVFLFTVWPLGAAGGITAAGSVTFVLVTAITGIAAVVIAGLGESADWPLVLRMAVAILGIVLVTIGLLSLIWLGAFLVLSLAIGPLFGLYAAAGVTLLALGVIVRQEFSQVESIEDRIDATPTTPDDLPGIHATTTKVASQLGVPKPTVAISRTHTPEAMVVGFRPSDVHLVLSYGTVTALTEDELEAVIAHELAHVANRDAMVMTAVSTPVVLADGLRAQVREDDEESDDGDWEPPEETPDADDEWGDEEIFGPNGEWRMGHHPSSDDDDDDDDDSKDSWIVRMSLYVVGTSAWIVSRAIVAVLSRARETTADRTAAEVTGSPAALAGALRTLDDRIDAMPDSDLREVASVSSLSILPLEPIVEGDEPSILDRIRARLFRTHPPTEHRLAVLEELERERR